MHLVRFADLFAVFEEFEGRKFVDRILVIAALLTPDEDFAIEVLVGLVVVLLVETQTSP